MTSNTALPKSSLRNGNSPSAATMNTLLPTSALNSANGLESIFPFSGSHFFFAIDHHQKLPTLHPLQVRWPLRASPNPLQDWPRTAFLTG